MKKDIFNLTIKVGMIFIVITTFFGVTYYQNAELAKELLAPYIEMISGMVDEDGGISWSKLFLNNVFASAQAVGMGIFPLIFLPVFVLLSNSIVTGAVMGLGMAEAGMNPVKTIVFGILPHGVFELPGLFLSIALGFYLCRYMTGALFRRKRDMTLLEALNSIAKTYVLGVLPLMTIASVIEIYVTPMLMEWAGI